MTPLKAATTEPEVSKPKNVMQNIKRGKQNKPVRILLQGVEGIGKSTFAADSISPVFLCAEDGVSNLDVARFPEPNTWADVLDILNAVIDEPHDFQTLVIDTIDWLEPLIFDDICKRHKVNNIDDLGYGKGYNIAGDMWRLLMGKLDEARAKRNMHIILLSHTSVKTHNNPEGENYDRYALKIHKIPAGLLKEWVDCVLFAAYDIGTVKDGKKAKGISSGSRILHTTWRAAYDAKNRFGLPDEIPLNWNEFWNGVQMGAVKAATLISKITELSAGTEYEEKCHAFIARHPDDVVELQKLADWINGKLQIGG